MITAPPLLQQHSHYRHHLYRLQCHCSSSTAPPAPQAPTLFHSHYLQRRKLNFQGLPVFGRDTFMMVSCGGTTSKQGIITLKQRAPNKFQSQSSGAAVARKDESKTPLFKMIQMMMTPAVVHRWQIAPWVRRFHQEDLQQQATLFHRHHHLMITATL